MHVFAQCFWTPKAGSRDAEYEDAFYPTAQQNGIQATEFCCAIADGATETSYSGLWAMQLVRAICKNHLMEHDSLQEHLPHLQDRWSRIVFRRFRKRQPPWFAEEKIRAGAFASILGLSVTQNTSNEHDGKWRAVAIGDCCLIHMRGDDILAKFPLEKSASFTNHPFLLSSNPSHDDRIARQTRVMQGMWMADDVFYLMTDALAHWFIKLVEVGQTPWKELRDLDTRDQVRAFQVLVNDLRTKKIMRNDDVTLLRLNIVV